MSFSTVQTAANTCYGLLGLSFGLYLKPPAACPACTCGTVHCGAVTESHYSWSGVCFSLLLVLLLTTGAWGLWRVRITPEAPAALIDVKVVEGESRGMRRSFAAAPEFAHDGDAVRR